MRALLTSEAFMREGERQQAAMLTDISPEARVYDADVARRLETIFADDLASRAS